MKHGQIEARPAFTAPAVSLPAIRARALDFVALTKPRVNLLVVATCVVGYYLGSGAAVNLLVLFHTMVGTALVAAGAAALNQVAERDTDGLMRRTRQRPLPAGRLQPDEARRFAVALSFLGVFQLAFGVNLLASAVAGATLLSYAAIYTPLKRRTWLATIVGAVPGALPPVIGWAAARGALSIEAWALFGIVFCWQIPHFLAIAWIYRDDYERAGLPVLPVLEPDGASTARQVVLYGAALVPVSLTPAMIGLTGGMYPAAAFLLSSGFLGLGLHFASKRTAHRARRLFLGSIVYLPLLWAAMIADRVSG